VASPCFPKGCWAAGPGIRGRSARAGTEMVYLMALQKHPPESSKGVSGSDAINSMKLKNDAEG
jgi:hypothetical protein